MTKGYRTPTVKCYTCEGVGKIHKTKERRLDGTAMVYPCRCPDDCTNEFYNCPECDNGTWEIP